MLQEDKWSQTHRDTENHSQQPKEPPNRPPTIWSYLSLNSNLSKSSVHCSAARGGLTGSKLLLGAIASKARPAPDQLSHNQKLHQNPQLWKINQEPWKTSFHTITTCFRTHHPAGQLVNYCGYGATPSSLPSWWSGWWRTHCFPNLTTIIWSSR